ncbi:MAG: porin, partial [Pseudomonadota bacterium]
LATFASIITLVATSPVLGQSNQELMDIIREQQRQIEELSKKVDALMGQTEAATEKAEQAAETAEQVEQDTNVVFKWGPAPTLQSEDGTWSFKVRGRLFVDGGYLGDDDGFFDDSNATELRAARLGVEGRIFKDFGYKFETDFADNDVDIKDAFIEYDGPVIEPVKFVRLGQFKTPNSLEELTSSRYITFMERAAITDAFDLDRRIGAGTAVGGENWGIEGGLFGQNVDVQDRNEGFAVAGRGYYAFEDLVGEDTVLHLGTSARFRDLDNSADDSEVRYRQRPFFHFTGTRSVDTGSIENADNDVFWGGEAALVAGRFSAQAEAANTWLQRSDGGDADSLWGAYGSVSYFLTDAKRNYSAGSGTFGRVSVDNPIHEGGMGAWEIAARYDYISLNDGGAEIRGGKQGTTIVGVNWYLNNYVRMMLDGAWTRVFDANPRDTSGNAAVDGSQNDIFGVGARAQVDF